MFCILIFITAFNACKLGLHATMLPLLSYASRRGRLAAFLRRRGMLAIVFVAGVLALASLLVISSSSSLITATKTPLPQSLMTQRRGAAAGIADVTMENVPRISDDLHVGELLRSVRAARLQG